MTRPRQQDSMTPLEFITLLRGSDQYIQSIFSEGGCYQFHLILSRLYGGTPKINAKKNHVVTCIDGINYDINGVNEEPVADLTQPDLELASNWSFSRTKMLSLGECKVCEEPFLI